MSKCFFIFLFFICLCFNAFCQKLYFENYTSKHGLVSEDVYKVFQDKKGYMWFFTNYGVMKFDGNNFKSILKNLPFKESFIYSFYENSNGKIWIANSNAKIYEVKRDSAFLISQVEKISLVLKKKLAEIAQLYVDDAENIFAVTKHCTYKFIKEQDYSAINLSDSVFKDSAVYRIINKKNSLIPIFSKIVYGNKVAYYLNQKSIKISIESKPFKFEEFDIPSLVLTGPKLFKKIGNEIYFSFHDKIVRLSDKENVKEIKLKSVITSFTKDEKGHLWVGTINNGLFELNNDGVIVNNYFSGKSINDVYIDSQNGIWVTTVGFGIYYCKNSNLFYFNESSPLGLPIVLMKKIDNDIYIFNNNGDFYKANSNMISLLKKNNDIKSDPLDMINYQGDFLVSYRHKTLYIDSHTGITKTITPNDKQFLLPYKYSKLNNDTLILLRKKTILIVFKDSILRKFEFDFNVSDCIYYNGKLLIASEDGIYEIFNNKIHQPYSLRKSKKCSLSKIVQGKNGDVWFCSRGYGLFKLDYNYQLHHYTTSEGLPSNIINDISFKTDNSILLSTNTGLFLSSKYKKWVQLFSEQVYSACEYKSNVFFATKIGVLILKNNPTELKNKVYFNLSALFLNGKLFNVNELSNLKYYQNNLEFNFDVISYSGNHSDIIYKLTGEKNIVAISKNKQIVLQSLTPGSYTLVASLVANSSSENDIIIPFEIFPAFWQTIWFKILVLFLGVLSSYLVGIEIFKFHSRKEDKKNKINQLISEYKLVALKAQINPHFISNCLTAIQQLIISNKLDEANQYLAKFSFLVRQVLNFSSKSTISLNEELAIVELNIELEQLRFEKNFEFIVEIDKEIDCNEIFVPPLICQPLVENAIWHGLLQLKNIRKGRLFIKIKLVADLLYVIIEDNGVGRSFNLNMVRELKESKGIEITKQRILNINNLYQVSTGSLNFEDLKDEMNNCIGTRVVIILPLITNYE